jgi:hypothetical protein
VATRDELAGQAWVDTELRQIALERDDSLGSRVWSEDVRNETFYVRFALAGEFCEIPIVREDLAAAPTDHVVQRWFREYLRKATA